MLPKNKPNSSRDSLMHESLLWNAGSCSLIPDALTDRQVLSTLYLPVLEFIKELLKIDQLGM